MLNFTYTQFVNFYIHTCTKEYLYTTTHHNSGHSGYTNIPERCRTRLLVVFPYSYNKTNQMHQFLKFIFGIKIYMFRTVPLSIIRSFSLYTQQWCMSYRFADSLRTRKVSANLCDIKHCCVYSEKLLMMERGTVRNMQRFIPKINLSNQCIQLNLL